MLTRASSTLRSTSFPIWYDPLIVTVSPEGWAGGPDAWDGGLWLTARGCENNEGKMGWPDRIREGVKSGGLGLDGSGAEVSRRKGPSAKDAIRRGEKAP